MDENCQLLKKRLKTVRNLMAENNCEALWLPHNNRFLLEIALPRDNWLGYLTGFNASAGQLIVTDKLAALFLDGRYIAAAQQEFKNSELQVFDYSFDEFASFLGQDPLIDSLYVADELVTVAQFSKVEKILQSSGISLRTGWSFWADVWDNRPSYPKVSLMLHPDIARQKSFNLVRDNLLATIRATSGHNKWGRVMFLMASADLMAFWTQLRIKGDWNIPIVAMQGWLTVDLKNNHVSTQTFCELSAVEISQEVEQHLKANAISLSNIDQMKQRLSDDLEHCDKLVYDETICPCYFVNFIEQAKLHQSNNQLLWQRAEKSDVQIKQVAAAHICDALAMVKFLSWLDNYGNHRNLQELDAVKIELYLERCRRQFDSYVTPSFEPIVGIGEFGALPHYRADKNNPPLMELDRPVVIDSGGHYKNGTTDITRTIIKVSKSENWATQHLQFAKCYRDVLAGLIECSQASFSQETTGADLDKIARSPLKKKQL